MSGAGAGIVFGVIAIAALGPIILAAGLAILAGGAIYAAGKAGIAIGKGIYAAHKAAEAKRVERARAELETVKGELREIAISRCESLKSAEEALALDYEKAVEEREKRMETARSRLAEADMKMDKLVLELPKYFEARQKSIREDVEKEINRFTASLDEKCSELINQASSSMESKRKEILEKLDAVSESLETKRNAYITYARDILLSAKSMFDALKKSYDCELYALTELQAVESTMEQIEKLLADSNVANARSAVMIAGMLSERVQILQVRVEQRTATYNNQKAMLEARMGELGKIVEATHNLTADDKEGILKPFVTEETDAVFWSENRLQLLWDKADKLKEKVDTFQYTKHMNDQSAAILAVELDELRLALEKEHTRERAFLLSKVMLSKMAGDVIASEQELGWELIEEPFYHNDDMRLPIELVFERDGDTKQIVLADEYDEEIQQYKQIVHRYLKEEGQVDERKRQEEDDALTKKMQALGHKDFRMACDKSTTGKKMTSIS